MGHLMLRNLQNTKLFFKEEVGFVFALVDVQKFNLTEIKGTFTLSESWLFPFKGYFC